MSTGKSNTWDDSMGRSDEKKRMVDWYGWWDTNERKVNLYRQTEAENALLVSGQSQTAETVNIFGPSISVEMRHLWIWRSCFGIRLIDYGFSRISPSDLDLALIKKWLLTRLIIQFTSVIIHKNGGRANWADTNSAALNLQQLKYKKSVSLYHTIY